MRETIPSAVWLAVVPCLAAIASGLSGWESIDFLTGEVFLYKRYATEMAAGNLPYLDFVMEYPPVAGIAFFLPYVAGAIAGLGQEWYRAVFLGHVVLWLYLLCLFSISTAGRWCQIPQHRATIRLLAFAGVLSPLLLWRFDIFPALLTSIALWSYSRRRAFSGGLWLGAGVLAKLYPVVFGPVLILGWMAERRWRSVFMFIAAGLGFCIAVVSCTLYYVGSGFWTFFSYHQHRGIQIESLQAGIIAAGHLLGLTSAKTVFGFGAWHIDSSWASPLLQSGQVAMIGVLLGLFFFSWLQFRREVSISGRVRPQSIVHALLAVLLAFILTNKVF